MQEQPHLNVSSASECQKKEILKYAAEVRKFEIERFLQRSAFFWTFIGAALVAYGALYLSGHEHPCLLIAAYGCLSSLAWTLQNRGSKYWQEAWEEKVRVVEKDVLGARLFSHVEPVQKKGIWGAARFSVSRLTIAVSDLTMAVWIGLIVGALGLHREATIDWIGYLITAVVPAYAATMLWLGRSSLAIDRGHGECPIVCVSGSVAIDRITRSAS